VAKTRRSLQQKKITVSNQTLMVNFKYPGLLNQHIVIDDVRLSIWSMGKINPNKLTLLSFAGWPFSGYTLWPIAALLQDHIQMISVDIPGFIGLSTATEFVVNAENVATLMTKVPAALGITNFGLFGYSLGGRYAIETFMKFKQSGPKQNVFSRILFGRRGPKFVVLLAPALNGPNVAYISTPEITKRVYHELKDRGGVLDFVQKMIATAFGKNLLKHIMMRDKLDVQLTEDLINRVRTELSEQLTGLKKEALLSAVEDVIYHDKTELVKELDVPTLFITGDRDTVITAEDTQKAAEIAPRGEIHLVRNAGHTIGATHFNRVAQHILTFLRNHYYI
jgi:pimeloyl-ACP methyl ester carboxylesterase